MICYGCRKDLPADAFHRDSSSSRGYSGKCRDCKKDIVKTEAQKERVREISRKHYQVNKEQHKAVMAGWRKNNKDKMLSYWHNYKAKLRANGPVDKDITRLKVYERDQGTCKICSKPCKYEESSIDHILAVNRGGTHTWGNVQNAHRVCNIKKSTQTMEKLDVSRF